LSRLIITSGIVLLGIGVGFFIAGQLDPMVHSAFKTGGILWSVIGGITLGIGIKVGYKSKSNLEALR
jgi:hypothetical protein